MTSFDLDLSKYDLGWNDGEQFVFRPEKGLSRDVVAQMSWWKGEPEWMSAFRLRSLRTFDRKPMADWFAVNMPDINFNDIYYYIRPTNDGVVDEWDALPDKIKETYEKLGIPEAERKYLAGVTSQYDCLRGSTLVWTTRGMKPIKAVEAGDEVLALNEATKTLEVAAVVGGGYAGDKEIFEITAGSRTIGASGNHPFLVLRDERQPGRQRARFASRWMRADELTVGDLVAVPGGLPEFGEPYELPNGQVTNVDLAWLFGLYLGNGDIKHSGGFDSVEFAIDVNDEGLFAEIVRVAAEQLGLTCEVTGDRVRLRARGTCSLASMLDLAGFGGGALVKRVPDWVLALPSDQRQAFLAGFIDADGDMWAHHTAKNPVITSGNESLLGDLRELAQLCGIGVSCVTSFTSRHPHHPERTIIGFRLDLSGDFDRLPLRSPKKSERLGQRRHAHRNSTATHTTLRAHTSDMLGYVRVESITPVGVEATYDIEVAGHHNFVAEGFVVHNSEVVYHKNREDLESRGILFCDMDTALREYPELVKKYFGSVIPPADNKFAALNTSVWSGGSFIYIPPGVDCEMPLQAYFRINSESAGQFERTLIIADEGSKVHYIEGCSAPVYTMDALHSAVVEIIVKPSARVTYTTIQNWSPNVYNLVTKRARVEAEGHMEWIDGNIGSKLTMKYPSVYLVGPKATGEVLSVAYAGAGQHQDAGAKMVHAAPETTSKIVSKSISKDGGITTYRGLVRVEEGAYGCKSHVQCDALILDEQSESRTLPYMEVGERDAEIGHEATVSKIADEQLFYLQSRGLSQEQAMGMIVNGFIEPVTRTLPMEYAVEWSRLIELQMEGSVG